VTYRQIVRSVTSWSSVVPISPEGESSLHAHYQAKERALTDQFLAIVPSDKVWRSDRREPTTIAPLA